MSAKQITLARLFTRMTVIFLVPTICVAAILVVLKLIRCEVLSQGQADEIVRWVKPIWPVIAQQYSFAERADPLGARYFALLVLILLMVLSLVSVCLTFEFLVNRKRLNMPVGREWTIAVSGPVLYVFFAFFDLSVGSYAKGQFWVDPLGIYYFRVCLVFMGVGMSNLFSLLSITKGTEQMLCRFRSRRVQ